ncbi:MAG: hypothetical protein HRT74_12440 [Flavobacteriales bacterium]|nr:hypothetical protein [Flavobacteriales bacterium]
MCRWFLLCVCIFAQLQLLSQEVVEENHGLDLKKGTWTIYWGYNKTNYNPSDIHFKGDGYDFTLYEVRAHDLPEKWDTSVYLNPTKLTIPQFNFRIGYFLDDKWCLSLGWDHMKYRINEFQRVRMSGTIDESRSEDYAGVYNNRYVTLDPDDFLTIEHTDGFNFVRLGLDRRTEVYQPQSKKYCVSVLTGASIGAMMPWTDFTLFGSRNRNFVHLAGYGVSANLGIRFEFLKYGFLQYQNQLGFAHMPDIILEGRSSARGEQKVTFIERSLALGAYIPLGK